MQFENYLKIFINNKDLYDTNSNNLTLLKEKIGFVHEQPFFYEDETVKEVLSFAINNRYNISNPIAINIQANANK